MNLKLGLIYDFIETHDLVLNIDHLSRCCGNGKKFQSFMIQTKLKPKTEPLKKMKRKLTLHDGKDSFSLMPSKVTIDDLFLIYIAGIFISSHTYSKLPQRV